MGRAFNVRLGTSCHPGPAVAAHLRRKKKYSMLNDSGSVLVRLPNSTCVSSSREMMLSGGGSEPSRVAAPATRKNFAMVGGDTEAPPDRRRPALGGSNA